MAAFEVIALDTATPQLRAPGASDTYTFPRAVELPLGTANGVLFLNGSKVVTSGSGLTFDGTNLETTGNATLANNKAFEIKNTGGTAQQVLTLGNDNNVYLGQVTSPTAASLFVYGNEQVFVAGGTEQMRLTSTGLGIGTSSPSVRLESNGVSSGATVEVLRLANTGVGGGTRARMNFYAANANYGAITGGFGASSPEMVFDINTSTGNFIWNNVGSEQMRLNTSGNLGLGGSAARATTVGSAVLNIFNGTAPVGTLANGISLYSDAGEAYVMDAAGNATLISPHDAETNQWIFRSKHTPTGKVLKIDVERLLRFVNDHFGLDAVQEFVEA